MISPYQVIRDFEEEVATWSGAKFGVAVESCTAALFLSLQYRKTELPGGYLGTVEIPARTYPGVPCAIIHSGGRVNFRQVPWSGVYELAPYRIVDGALRFQKNMYEGGLHCLSFHLKKHLPIGRGGMILTNDEKAYKWLKKARFDGRDEVPLLQDNFTMLGWNMYMQPEQASRGLQLFSLVKGRVQEDLKVEEQGYPNLAEYKIYGTHTS